MKNLINLSKRHLTILLKELLKENNKVDANKIEHILKLKEFFRDVDLCYIDFNDAHFFKKPETLDYLANDSLHWMKKNLEDIHYGFFINGIKRATGWIQVSIERDATSLKRVSIQFLERITSIQKELVKKSVKKIIKGCDIILNEYKKEWIQSRENKEIERAIQIIMRNFKNVLIKLNKKMTFGSVNLYLE